MAHLSTKKYGAKSNAQCRWKITKVSGIGFPLAYKKLYNQYCIAWSVTCWDMRAIQIAQDLAQIINQQINHCDNPIVPELKRRVLDIMHKQTCILLTAFEPFGGAETNITQSVLSLLPDSIADWAIEKVCLPVSFKRSPIMLREAIATYSPDLVIMLGQCSTGENIRLERFAINMMDSSKADNDGYTPNEETIYANQPLALQTTLPIKELLRFCTDDVLPVKISNSAGLYVCNRVYYEALHLHQRAIFVHIPKNVDIKTAITIIKNLR